MFCSTVHEKQGCQIHRDQRLIGKSPHFCFLPEVMMLEPLSRNHGKGQSHERSRPPPRRFFAGPAWQTKYLCRCPRPRVQVLFLEPGSLQMEHDKYLRSMKIGRHWFKKTHTNILSWPSFCHDQRILGFLEALQVFLKDFGWVVFAVLPFSCFVCRWMQQHLCRWMRIFYIGYVLVGMLIAKDILYINIYSRYFWSITFMKQANDDLELMDL